MGCLLPQRVMLFYNEDARRQGLPPNRYNPSVKDSICPSLSESAG